MANEELKFRVWTCSACGEINKGTRPSCNICGIGQPLWNCLSCGEQNKEARSVCNNCFTKRPWISSAPAGISMASSHWTCVACGEDNKQTRETCNGCQSAAPSALSSGSPKGNHASIPGQVTTSSGMLGLKHPMLSEWICTICAEENPGSITTCNGCNAKHLKRAVSPRNNAPPNSPQLQPEAQTSQQQATLKKMPAAKRPKQASVELNSGSRWAHDTGYFQFADYGQEPMDQEDGSGCSKSDARLDPGRPPWRTPSPKPSVWTHAASLLEKVPTNGPSGGNDRWRDAGSLQYSGGGEEQQDPACVESQNDCLLDHGYCPGRSPAADQRDSSEVAPGWQNGFRQKQNQEPLRLKGGNEWLQDVDFSQHAHGDEELVEQQDAPDSFEHDDERPDCGWTARRHPWQDPAHWNSCTWGAWEWQSNRNQDGITQPVRLHDTLFAQDSIGWAFKDGRTLEGTLSQLQGGTLGLSELPTIRVVRATEGYRSLDNRRLWVMKAAFPQTEYPNKMIEVKLMDLSHPGTQKEFHQKFTAGQTARRRRQNRAKGHQCEA